MDNNKDFTKVLDGLKGAQNLLKTHMTTDVLKSFTPEQLKDYNKAIDNSPIIKSMKDIENFTKNFK